MSKTVMESAMSGVIGGLAGGYLVGMGNKVPLLGMPVNSIVGIGGVVFAADLIAEYAKAPVLNMVGAESPQAEMIVPPLVTGVATWALFRGAVGGGAFVPSVALGAVSSALGAPVYHGIWG